MSGPKRVLDYLNDRTGIADLIGGFARHLVPPNIGWAYVLGSATLTAFIIQVVTGIALATAYVPSAADAYDSLQFITRQALFGSLLRGMHFIGASAMVLLIGLHALRTFLMGAYKFPREMNWIAGTVLLFATLAMAFTGQLLRWDQNAIWSVVVAAEQIGRVPLIGDWLARFTLAGDTVGGATLSRFFAFHVFSSRPSSLVLLDCTFTWSSGMAFPNLRKPGGPLIPKRIGLGMQICSSSAVFHSGLMQHGAM